MGMLNKGADEPLRPPPVDSSKKKQSRRDVMASSAKRERERTGSGARSPSKRRRRGCGGVLIDLVSTIFFALLAAILILFHRPADLTQVGGWSELVDTDVVAGGGREVLDELRIAAGGRDVYELSETDLNRYLHSRVVGYQEGDSEGYVRFVGAWCDCKDGGVEIYLEREVLGLRSTMSLELSLERADNEFLIRFAGGSYGVLRVPSGFAYLMKPVFVELSEELEPELDAVFDMDQIEFFESGVRLTPLRYTAAE